MAVDRLGGLDMAFLCMEHPGAPLHMGAIAVFRARQTPDPRRIVALLSARAHEIPRMRQQARPSWYPLAAAVWAEDSRFTADDHIHAHALPRGSGHDELAALAARLIAEPLDLTRPLWELHVITGLVGDRFAVLVKLHHAMCDGAAAVGLVSALLDGANGTATAPRRPATEGVSAGAARRYVRELVQRPSPLRSLIDDAAEGAGTALRRVNRNLDIAAAVLGNTRLPSPDSPLLSGTSGPRRIGLLTLSVPDLYRVRRRYGGTLNDVALTVTAGALHRWLAARGYPTGDMVVRALIPVSQRHRATDPAGNQLSGYVCELPVGESDPVRRLEAIRASMDRNKAAGPQRGPGAVPLLADQLPSVVHRLVMPFARCAAPALIDTVITTVPLPRLSLSLDDAVLDEIYPLVPIAAGHALGIAIARYRDSVHIGLHANGDALPDLEKLSDAFPDALAEFAVPTADPTGFDR